MVSILRESVYFWQLKFMLLALVGKGKSNVFLGPLPRNHGSSSSTVLSMVPCTSLLMFFSLSLVHTLLKQDTCFTNLSIPKFSDELCTQQVHNKYYWKNCFMKKVQSFWKVSFINSTIDLSYFKILFKNENVHNEIIMKIFWKLLHIL